MYSDVCIPLISSLLIRAYGLACKVSTRASACFLGVMLNVLLCSSVSAVEVEDLFTATTEVESRSDEIERQRAFSRTMREVLLKVSGQTQTLSLPAVRRAINSPQSYVESWAYRTFTLPSVEMDGGEQSEVYEQTDLEVTFFEPEILRLLEQQGLAHWSSNRPLTLVWLVEQDATGERSVVNASNPMRELLEQQAGLRGLPLVFPLMDFDDLRQLDVERLWNLDQQHIDQLSRRYGGESILVIRVFSSLGNEYLGRSLFSFQGRELVNDLYAQGLEELVAGPVSEVAEELSAYYAVLLSGTQSEVTVRMQVEGIDSVEDYAGLINYVEELADVNKVSIVSVLGTSVELKLVTGGQIRQLVESIGLDRNLLPVREVIRVEDDVLMQYRWR